MQDLSGLGPFQKTPDKVEIEEEKKVMATQPICALPKEKKAASCITGSMMRGVGLPTIARLFEQG